MVPNGKTVALVVAAGTGSRVGGDLPKQYRRLAGRTILSHALERLRHPGIDEILVVIAPGQEQLYRESVDITPLPAFAIGGATRQQSVRNGLETIAASGGAAHVLIHDAARPFMPPAVVDRLLQALDHAPGAVPVLPVIDTLARSDGRLGAPVPREDVVRIQTPQAFRFEAILAAHRGWPGEQQATDDAQVLRALGMDVATVMGDRSLEKLTFEEDFTRAERLMQTAMTARTGLGFDVHAFCKGDHVWLGGLRIPHSRGLAGHSDADVLLHAVTDALLGAIGAGDIGDHFPPGDPKWRGAPSSGFVEHACRLVAQRGGRIEHVDATLICEQPRLSPHKDAVRRNMAALLGIPLERVSVKATTTERLGFTGRGEGVAAQAIATVSLPEEQ